MTADPKIDVLFVAAEPEGTSPIRLAAEFRDVIRLVKRDSAGRIRFHSLWAARQDDVLDALQHERPTVVHFSAHGTAKGDLVLEDVDGTKKAVSPEAMGALFQEHGSDVQVVILNSCYSESMAEVLARSVGAVIGMSDAIDIQAAIAFSTGFYRALACKESIRDCFDKAVAEMKFKGFEDADLPVIYTRPGVKAWKVFATKDGSEKTENPAKSGDAAEADRWTQTASGNHVGRNLNMAGRDVNNG